MLSEGKIDNLGGLYKNLKNVIVLCLKSPIDLKFT